MIRRSQTKIILPFGIFLFLLLSSCSSLKKDQIQKQTDDADRQAQMEIGVGEFQKAIDLHREIYQKYPQDPGVQSGYIHALEAIKSLGDEAFERQDFKLAGMIYEILQKNWAHFAEFSQSFSFDKTFLEKKIKTSRCLLIEEQLSSYLKSGDFRKAIELCRESYQKYPQDPGVRSGYIKTLESIKSSGDRAFEKKDFALAGCAYETLLKNFSSVKQWNGAISFSREGLTTRVENCRKILFQNGLEQYRSGNLNQAIALWKSILIFDPENQEIRKAVDMATLQYKNLQGAK